MDQPTNDRRARVAQITNKSRRVERTTRLALIGGAVVVGLGLVAAAAIPVLRQAENTRSVGPLTSIGATLTDAACTTATAPANGGNNHIPFDQPIPYETAPPAFGPHYPSPAGMSRKFYTADDRPVVGLLVHNLEHGFTVLWYDETIADDAAQVTDLKNIAAKFTDTSGNDDKFIVAPWTTKDGEKFPGGAHVALTHWSMGSTNGNPAEQTGVWNYCKQVSGATVSAFIKDYPYADAPEGSVPGTADTQVMN